MKKSSTLVFVLLLTLGAAAASAAPLPLLPEEPAAEAPAIPYTVLLEAPADCRGQQDAPVDRVEFFAHLGMMVPSMASIQGQIGTSDRHSRGKLSTIRHFVGNDHEHSPGQALHRSPGFR